MSQRFKLSEAKSLLTSAKYEYDKAFESYERDEAELRKIDIDRLIEEAATPEDRMNISKIIKLRGESEAVLGERMKMLIELEGIIRSLNFKIGIQEAYERGLQEGKASR